MPQNPPAFRRIYAAGPPVEVLLHALAPERMLGWTAQKPEAALALLGASERKLPVLGGINGRGRPVSLEELLAAKVDLVIDAGTVNDGMLSTGEHTAKQLGVPYLLIDGRLDQAAEQVPRRRRIVNRPQRLHTHRSHQQDRRQERRRRSRRQRRAGQSVARACVAMAA